MNTVAHVPYLLGRAVPMLAAASSGIGERQGGVKGVETMIMTQFGKARRSGKQARAQQWLGRVVEHVGCMPTRLDECSHCVNYDIRPR